MSNHAAPRARHSRARCIFLTAILIPLLQDPRVTFAQQPPVLQGHIRDPLGALVPGASVELLENGRVVERASATADGAYRFVLPGSGRYRVRVSAPTFGTTITLSTYVRGSAASELDVTLATATLTQQVTVTAEGAPLPEAQTGASVSVLPANDFRLQLQVQDPLRLVPGVQDTQTGQLGGITALSIRGAGTDANKVLIDGIPADAVGGGVDFSTLDNVGFSSLEVLREPNSAIYGSDALAGVVSLTTARGATRLPLFTYAGEAGNFGTYRNEVTAGTVYRQFDLYSAFARLDSRNDMPGSEFHNATYAGNFGWTPNAANDLRFTVRHLAEAGGQPNAIAFYGIPDAAVAKAQDDVYNAAWNNQTTARWHNQVRYGGLRLHSQYDDFGATGLLDANGYYDGKVVTISGANGYSVTGQAIFQYSATPYQSLSTTTRDFVYAQTDYQVSPHLLALGAFKFEEESGSSGDAGSPQSTIQRGNYSYTAQFSGDVRQRLFLNAGTGLEDNGLYGFAATPRASLAYYLAKPNSAAFFSGTKLHGTFSKGIKEPSVFQQTYSLYNTLQQYAPQLISQYNVGQLGAVNSRTFDGGIDQQFGSGRARAGITWFHDEFTNVVEYVPPSGLLQLGVPGAAILESNYTGAYLNSQAFRTQGIEFESEYRLQTHLFARGGYTYTDAVVQRSFSSDNLAPSYNTSSSFSTVPIGAYSPLVGARPFRVAPHTGYFDLDYSGPRISASFSGTLVSRRDDSTYLSDTNFGPSLLLPNRNLLGSYQRLDLGGGYHITPRVEVFANLQNLLSEHYYEAFGYPALPLTFRTGLKLNFGGESWSLR